MRLHWTFFAIPALTSGAFVHQNQRHEVSSGLGLWKKVKSHHPSHVVFSTASPEQSEAERLLQRARELRQSALEAEHQVHVSLAEKKAQEDEKTDNLIDLLFFSNDGSTLVDRLHEKNLSIETLERIVVRLDEREVIAEGKEHVRLVHNEDGKATFERVCQQDDKELARVRGKIEELIEGVSVLDDEIRRKKNAEGDNRFTHTEIQHWGSDKRAERLTNRAHEIQREREEQFQKRLAEFYEAQRIKKDRPPPPKVKDDHGLLP